MNHGTVPLDNWQTPWAVLPEVLLPLARVLSRGPGDEELHAEIARQAAVIGEAPAARGATAVIPLRGLLTPRPSLMSILFGGGGGLEQFRASLRHAIANDEIDSVVLDVDSPGGSTDLMTETAAEIRAARTAKPVVAVANATAGSAAYWLASQADEMVVTPSGQVGSIGIFGVHQDDSGFHEKLGVVPTVISAGKYKTELASTAPLSDEAREAAQQTVDDFYELFVNDVARGRGVTAEAVRNGFGEGRMVTAKRAVETGMADTVGTFERAVARAAKPEDIQRRAAAPELAPVAQETQQETSQIPTAERPEEDRARIAALVLARPNYL